MVSQSSSPGATVVAAGSPSEPVVRVTGELDLSSADAVRSALEATVTDSAERVELDLGDLAFLDSSGLSIFVELAGRVPVTIVAASEPVRRVIGVTGLGDVLGLPS
jgi:anti-sigma B factor antagonist